MQKKCGSVVGSRMKWRMDIPMMMVVMVMMVMMMSSFLTGSVAASSIRTERSMAVQQHSVCEDDGAGLRCPQGYTLHVLDASCGRDWGSQQPCDPQVKETLLQLCQGKPSCAGLGLAQVFGMLCLNSSAGSGRLVVAYTCRRYAARSVPPCTANLCSNATRMLRCPQQSVLHVRNVTCRRGRETCALPTWLMLYSLCEGRQGCDAWGLRLLRPLSQYCQQGPDPWDRNVFMDFVCVPNTLVHSECRQETVKLTAPFGVLMSPGFTGTATGKIRQCDWLLKSHDLGDVVQVMVHMAYSRRQPRDGQAMQFLRVDYEDCDSGERIMREFYDLSDVNIALTSCGSVRVTSWLPAQASVSPPFLLSYHMTSRGSKVAPPRGMRECRTPLVTPLPATHPHPHTTSPTFSRRNYGPGRTMFDYSDTIRHLGSDSKMTDHDNDDTFQLKLTLLYAFFGVVILALLIALIYVLMSYRGISRRGRHGSDSSEKTALWRHEDTPLHTFSHNSRATLADVANCDLYPPSPDTRRQENRCNDVDDNDDDNDDADAAGASGSPDSQVVACTVHAKSADEEQERRLSAGSAFSSFLSGKDMDLQDLLDSFHPADPGHPAHLAAAGPDPSEYAVPLKGAGGRDCDVTTGKNRGDYDVIAGQDTGDYDVIAGKDAGDYDTIVGSDAGPGDYNLGGHDGGDYDIIAGKDIGDYDSIGDVFTTDVVTPRRNEEEEEEAQSSARSNAYLMNGDAGNIYECIDDRQGRRPGHSAATLRPKDDPPSPHPPAPPPFFPCNDQSHPSFVEHYTINDDDYALVRKPRASGGGTLPRSGHSDVARGPGSVGVAAQGSANGLPGGVTGGLVGVVHAREQTSDSDTELGFQVGERV